MYIKVTTYGFDESRLDEALAKMDGAVRKDLQSIAGLESVDECRIGEGQGMIISRYDSEESATAAQPKIQEILGEMAEYMTSPPEVKAGDVIWSMQVVSQILQSPVERGFVLYVQPITKTDCVG